MQIVSSANDKRIGLQHYGGGGFHASHRSSSTFKTTFEKKFTGLQSGNYNITKLYFKSIYQTCLYFSNKVKKTVKIIIN